MPGAEPAIPLGCPHAGQGTGRTEGTSFLRHTCRVTHTSVATDAVNPFGEFKPTFRVPLWAQEPTLPLDGILPAAWGTHCRQLHAAKLPAGNKSLVVSILGGHVGSGRSPHTFNCPSRVHTRGLNTVVTPATHFKCSSHMGPAATTLDSKYGERVQKVLQAVLV